MPVSVHPAPTDNFGSGLDIKGLGHIDRRRHYVRRVRVRSLTRSPTRTSAPPAILPLSTR